MFDLAKAILKRRPPSQLRGTESEVRMKTTYFLVVTAAVTALSLAAYIPAGAADAAATGSLKGTAKFEGSALKPARIDMSSDPTCAKAHTTPATTEDLVIGANGGLANVIVYVSDGLGDRTFEPPQQPAVIEQKGCQYKPHVLALQANQKLDVVNDDATTHNIHPMPNNNREWNKTQPHGMPVEETFAREEIAIPVKCNVHPWMRGYIAVFKHPYFVVSDKDGNFDLKDLPPGTYTIKAWQEKLGTQSQKITVGASETKTLEFVFKSGS
jgi:plastocyanin